MTGLATQLKQLQAIVVPIPLSTLRERERGFNQSALIAERFAKYFDLSYQPHLIRRTIDRMPQAKISTAAERQKNIKGVFQIGKDLNKVQDKTILLVDDVATSGATLEEAGRILKRAGVKKILAIVIARG